MTAPLWLTIPLCLLAAAVIAFGCLGFYALWDIFTINKKDDWE